MTKQKQEPIVSNLYQYDLDYIADAKSGNAGPAPDDNGLQMSKDLLRDQFVMINGKRLHELCAGHKFDRKDTNEEHIAFFQQLITEQLIHIDATDCTNSSQAQRSHRRLQQLQAHLHQGGLMGGQIFAMYKIVTDLSIPLNNIPKKPLYRSISLQYNKNTDQIIVNNQFAYSYYNDNNLYIPQNQYQLCPLYDTNNVINDNGGSAGPDDFGLTIDGTQAKKNTEILHGDFFNYSNFNTDL